jgi:hypothetical protein
MIPSTAFTHEPGRKKCCRSLLAEAINSRRTTLQKYEGASWQEARHKIAGA